MRKFSAGARGPFPALFGIGTVVVLLGSVTAVAHAQEMQETVTYDVVEEATVRAPKNSFELGVNGGYTQPFGEINAGNDIHHLVDAGGAVGLALGWRISPYVSVEGVGQYHESTTGDDLNSSTTDVRGVSTGVQATVHMMPYERVDPLLSFGSGYRMMWIVPEGAPNTFLHGLSLARATFGVDFRATDSVALGPQVGADLNMFLFEDGPGDADDDNVIDDIRPSTFLFAGLGGRFDMGGKRDGKERTVARRVMTPRPAAGPAPAPKPAPAPAPEPPTAIRIDPAILEACKIDQKKAFFEFDKSNVRSPDQATLDLVAVCFTSGPLKGRALNIVGNADPRGTDEYNMGLGQRRANSVQEYLGTQGLTNGAVSTESRGEKDATGTDESSWAYDRRVDLKLRAEGTMESTPTTPQPSTPQQPTNKQPPEQRR
ncbi:MAG: OmpA family protein [Polyangiaceae bacterium]|nr:OmpA family protein [Polyangiaceae bacterium]